MKNPKLIDKLFQRLPPKAHRALLLLLSVAQAQGASVYLVGGPVRDLILERPSLDLDLAVEVDAIALARSLTARLGAWVTVHPAFGTAALKGDGFAIDLATARTETYEQPGALPTVRPGSIEDDLLRRDFAINAMALRLTDRERGALLDPAGGRSDLDQGLVRVLHENSFRDDATRILRAARYEARFRFRIEDQTARWLKRDCTYIDTISGARLRQEIGRILAEPAPERILLRLQELGALRAVHPALTFDAAAAQAFARLRALNPGAAPAGYWPLLALALDDQAAAALSTRLALTKAQAQAVTAMPRLLSLRSQLERPNLKRSDLAQAMDAFPPTAVWALAAASASPVPERCRDYLRNIRYVKPALRGDDILAIGVPPGPRVGQMLRRLKVAKLDGEVKTRRDEERLVRSMASPSG